MKAKMPDRVVVETSPRHSLASNSLAERAIRTVGKQLRTFRYDRHAESGYDATHTWHPRYARGAGGITPFGAAHDRDYTQEIAPFAEIVLFKILAPEHRKTQTP